MIRSFSALSFNQPKFCSSVTWYPFGSTFAELDDIDMHSIFLTTNNSIYIIGLGSSGIYISLNDSIKPTKIASNTLWYPKSVFVENNNEIYITTSTLRSAVSRWILNTNTQTPVMDIPAPCYAIFIDINKNLYCSLDLLHRVLKKWLGNNNATPVTVAGTGIPGPASNMLNAPTGIVVDVYLNLYVADFFNNRIQLFEAGQSDATTVAGRTSVNLTISLNQPTGITLDGDGCLYIVDRNNHRIVRGDSVTGFRCILGCDGFGKESHQLSGPRHMAFDSYGNIYVVDTYNRRIQKFIYSEKSCDPINTNASSITSSENYTIHRPRFCPAAVWNPFGTTFLAENRFHGIPHFVFITTKNYIYIFDHTSARIYIWFNATVNSTISLSRNTGSPRSVFVKNDNEIYVDTSTHKPAISRWILNTNTHTPVMDIPAPCYAIFIDINNNLYCSLDLRHRVLKKWLGNNNATPVTVAGTGTPGPASNMLNTPTGIVVDIYLNLYVADFFNNRIQLFEAGQSDATTVAGRTSVNLTISLNQPTGITLDGDGYLYIVDRNNHRIVRGDSVTGFRCILGCEGYGKEPYKLWGPRHMAFDIYGNIYVVDTINRRIQKFMYSKRSCDRATTNASSITSSENLPFNQPKFCLSPTWDSYAATFVAENTIGGVPHSIFITANNSIHVFDYWNARIYVFLNETANSTISLSRNSGFPKSIFVENNNELYIEKGDNNHVVEKLILDTNKNIPVMSIYSSCYALFIDINNNLYCSLIRHHRVLKTWVGDDDTTPILAAGTGTPGSTSYMLNAPTGIVVDRHLNLYVADSLNHRVQLFQAEQPNGITVVGLTSKTRTINLNHPTGITLDGDGYLYIVDRNNHRIVRGNSVTGFRCILGCVASGKESYQLLGPQHMAFDIYGNIYVVDSDNRRIQKFMYSKRSCEPNGYITNFTFTELMKRNISSEHLYSWFAPIDSIENYQLYLNKLSSISNNEINNDIFYHCAKGRFGLMCQYEIDDDYLHNNMFDYLIDFYRDEKPFSESLTCYMFIQCDRHSSKYCLDWSEICDGKVDCFNGPFDEEHCSQIDINNPIYKPIETKYVINENIQHLPILLVEDVKCRDLPLTSSCIPGRQERLLKAILSINDHSTSLNCSLAFKCILPLSNDLSSICNRFCGIHECLQLIENYCPDMFYMPSIPILFNNIYFAYEKTDSIEFNNKNFQDPYICYSNSIYDNYFINDSMKYFNGTKCYRRNIPFSSSNQKHVFDIAYIQSIYNIFKYYNLRLSSTIKSLEFQHYPLLDCSYDNRLSSTNDLFPHDGEYIYYLCKNDENEYHQLTKHRILFQLICNRRMEVSPKL
ncbi:unnamed protein product, partial [Adineta ricciae]